MGGGGERRGRGGRGRAGRGREKGGGGEGGGGEKEGEGRGKGRGGEGGGGISEGTGFVTTNNPAWHHPPTREQVLLQTQSASGWRGPPTQPGSPQHLVPGDHPHDGENVSTCALRPGVELCSHHKAQRPTTMAPPPEPTRTGHTALPLTART